MIGTMLHVGSENIKFIYLGHWSTMMFELIGLGELFSNYYLAVSVTTH